MFCVMLNLGVKRRPTRVWVRSPFTMVPLERCATPMITLFFVQPITVNGLIKIVICLRIIPWCSAVNAIGERFHVYCEKVTLRMVIHIYLDEYTQVYCVIKILLSKWDLFGAGQYHIYPNQVWSFIRNVYSLFKE